MRRRSHERENVRRGDTVEPTSMAAINHAGSVESMVGGRVAHTIGHQRHAGELLEDRVRGCSVVDAHEECLKP